MKLLGYFVAYFSLGFVWRTWLVRRRTGINPLVLATGDHALGYVSRAFKITLIAAGCTVATHAFAPSWLSGWGQLPWIGSEGAHILGWTLLGLALIGLGMAQAQMGHAWRIGIDQAHRTTLVETGLFRFSRNPIFLAMRITLLGQLLVLPHAVTLGLLCAGEILMQVQVRLEEEHLEAQHGATYLRYRARVRRWI
jgi:protein-S-isoprenylcysteine O-methyltransferase Ste14